MNPAPSRTTSSLPGRILALFLLSLAVLAWPNLLQKIVSLDWRLGNMRPVAYGAQTLFGLLAAIAWLVRRRIGSLYARVFPTGKLLVFKLAAISASVVLGLFLIEIFLRRVDDRVPRPSFGGFDSELGWINLPHRAVPLKDWAIYTDSHGARVQNAHMELDPNAPTALFIGCSYTLGYGLPYELSFPGQLQSTTDFPLQVVDLGVTGYGTGQALLMLKRSFKRFRTKLVVYTFIYDHVRRDATYFTYSFRPSAGLIGTKPLFALSKDGTVYVKKRPLRHEDISYPRLWALLQIAANDYGPRAEINLTRALVREMEDYTESNGAGFVVIYWYQGNAWDESSRALYGFPFSGMNLNVIDPSVDPPAGWNQWMLSNAHPDARANRYVAQLFLQAFKQRGEAWFKLPTRPPGNAQINLGADE